MDVVGWVRSFPLQVAPQVFLSLEQFTKRRECFAYFVSSAGEGITLRYITLHYITLTYIGWGKVEGGAGRIITLAKVVILQLFICGRGTVDEDNTNNLFLGLREGGTWIEGA